MPRQREDEGEQQTQHPPRTKKKGEATHVSGGRHGKSERRAGRAGRVNRENIHKPSRIIDNPRCSVGRGYPHLGDGQRAISGPGEPVRNKDKDKDPANKRGAAQQQCSAARALKENREMEEKAQRGSWSPAAGQSWDGDKMLLRRFLGGAPDGARARDFGSMSSWAGGHGAVPRFQVPSELSRVEFGSCSQQFVSRRLAAWHGLGMGMDEPAIHYLTSRLATRVSAAMMRCGALRVHPPEQGSPARGGPRALAPRRRATLLHDDGRSSKRVHDSSMLRRDGRHPPAQFEPWGCCHAAPQGTTLILNPPSPPDPGAKACLACWRLFQARANSARRPGHAPRNKPPQSGGSNTGVGYGQRIVPRVKYTRRCVERQLQHVAPQVRADHQFGGPADATTEHRITMTPAAKTGFCRCVRAPPACRQFHQARAPRSPFVPPAASNSDLASGRLFARKGKTWRFQHAACQLGQTRRNRAAGAQTGEPHHAITALLRREGVCRMATPPTRGGARSGDVRPAFTFLYDPARRPCLSLTRQGRPLASGRREHLGTHTHSLHFAAPAAHATPHSHQRGATARIRRRIFHHARVAFRLTVSRARPGPPPGPPCPPTAVVAVADQPWLPADGEGEGARDAQRRVTGWGR
ncbi:hypothetical protein PCL_06474 [Purpureocillium lilacinum]|uniref:Uncharacterized protein n=1 Tax=Purpureocillium lilacinum TaxID=33203 RepID=A0A2U3EMS3_PURLI|nr:hypothetical protein PCL_06474 [Purpureocillium lilacinum]